MQPSSKKKEEGEEKKRLKGLYQQIPQIPQTSQTSQTSLLPCSFLLQGRSQFVDNYYLLTNVVNTYNLP